MNERMESTAIRYNAELWHAQAQTRRFAECIFEAIRSLTEEIRNRPSDSDNSDAHVRRSES